MKPHQTTILRQEASDAGGDAGGGAVAAPTTPAAPAEAPTSPLSTPAAEGQTMLSGEQAQPPAATPTQGGWQADSWVTKMFDLNSGTLRNGWEDVAKENGLENAIGHIGRDGLGGSLDGILKSGLNLATLTGKKIDGFTPEEAASLPLDQKDALLGKLMDRPAEAADYGMREMEAFKGQELPDETVNYWQETFKEAGLTKEQAAIVGAKYNQFGEQQTAAQQQAMEAAQAEKDAEIMTHFRQEWGEDFGANKDMVEQFIESRLDAENPTHKAIINDQLGLELIHTAAKAQAAALREGTMPAGTPAITAGSADQQFEEFLAVHPAWQSDSNPKVRERGLYLSQLGARRQQ